LVRDVGVEARHEILSFTSWHGKLQVHHAEECYPAIPFPLIERTMSIGFRVKTDEELSAEFRTLTEKQLIETGKILRDFAKLRPGQGPDVNWLRQLRIAREVWRERHPPKKLRD
jgi:hypothetical protein